MLVFAVETSCDETSVCILNKDKKILSHKKFINSDFDVNWLVKESFY